MQDGLYSVRFSGPFGQGSGVIVIAGGKFYGGDAGIAYAGTIDQQGSEYTVTLNTIRHSNTGTGSVLGSDTVKNAILKGHAPDETSAVLSMPVPGSSTSFQAMLKKLVL